MAVDGRRRPLTRLSAGVLLRLALAQGEAVPLNVLYTDVWRQQPSYRAGPPDRTKVHQRITALRALLGPDSIETLDGAGTGYRLTVDRRRIDLFLFEGLIRSAAVETAHGAIAKLGRALALWHGPPPAFGFAAGRAQTLQMLRHGARHSLAGLLAEVGRTADAAALAYELLAEDPDDSRLRGLATGPEPPPAVLEAVGVRPGVTFSVVAGDLFEQQDAHLVVGFNDTFDTSVKDDRIIDRRSIQGQLLTRCFDGDQPRLDRALKAALARTAPTAVESRRDKPRGKLRRYPLGTVAVLDLPERRVFAVAYSSMGNDLICRSSLERLSASLDRLWDQVFLQGQRKPVAMAMVGAGLARIDDADPQRLAQLVGRSFAQRSLRGVVTRELRLVVRPSTIGRLDLPALRVGLGGQSSGADGSGRR
ncbi:macro domain-containing protein [Kitasatospora sp. NPDC058965]|uniref:macro domain-containing protein n=1 Tax=Kitasatospora sp. NPDC058965 TaxID=3346682 RepID=UPI00369B1696